MAFELEATRTATGILDLMVTMNDVVSEDVQYQAISLQYNVEMNTGEIVHRRVNLVPHITTAQRNGLIAFMAAVRTLLETEVLP